MEDKLLIEARGLGKDYYFHKIFDFLDDLELFYDALSINSCSLVYGVLVTGKVSIDTAMYTSIEGTIESIKFLIYAGRLGDAFALVRKYADGVFVNLYLYTLLARAEDAYLTPEKTLEDIALEADIHSWSCDRWRLFYKLDKVYHSLMQVDSQLGELLGINQFGVSTNIDYRQCCNDSIHYNSWESFAINNYLYVGLGRKGGDLLDELYAIMMSHFILHFSYTYVQRPMLYRSSYYDDCLDGGETSVENSQYWVDSIFQKIFDKYIRKENEKVADYLVGGKLMDLK